MNKTAWLIENGEFGDDIRYRSIKDTQIIWVKDPYKALWFVRKVDAALFSAEDEDAWFITEHEFEMGSGE